MSNPNTDNGGEGDVPGEAQLLVSEFPPPPNYYHQASSLTPPTIPIEALKRGTHRAAVAAAKARAESTRLRLLDGREDIPDSDAILGGEENVNGIDDGEVVAVFGEIVEDPYLVEVLDHCEDPKIVRDEVHRLNREVVQLFVGLVKDLVHKPLDNKKRRDELSHNIFLMLQECNKFREHQAREVLISMLQQQLESRQAVLSELKEEVREAEIALGFPQTSEN